MSHHVLLRRRDLIFVRIPQRIPKTLHVLQPYRVAKTRSVLHVSPLKVFHRLLASMIFSVRRVQHNLRIEALFQLLSGSLPKRFRAVMHMRFHLAVHHSRIRLCRAHGSHLPLQIDGHPHLVQQVHAQNSVHTPASRSPLSSPAPPEACRTSQSEFRLYFRYPSQPRCRGTWLRRTQATRLSPARSGSRIASTPPPPAVPSDAAPSFPLQIYSGSTGPPRISIPRINRLLRFREHASP